MRIIDPVWRIAVAAAALALSIVVLALGPAAPVAIVLVAALLIGGGAVAARAWIPTVPFAGAAVFCLSILALEGADVSDSGQDTTWGMLITGIVFAAMLASVGLAFGVALRWGIDAWADRRRDRARGSLVTR